MIIRRLNVALLVLLALSVAVNTPPLATAQTPPEPPTEPTDPEGGAQPPVSVAEDVVFSDEEEVVDPTADQPPADEPPADEPPTPEEAKIDMILTALEAAGRENEQVVAEIDYQFDERMTGDSEHRTGSIKYQRQTEETPPRFYVGFETLQLGDGAVLKDKVEYAFDGQWLTLAKHRIKQMTRYQIAAEGQQIDAFKLGKGPFPLPFGQEAAVMHEHFDIITRDATEADPPNTWYLRLSPKEEIAEEMTFTRLDMWIDIDSHLPVRLISRDKNKNRTTVAFDEIETDVELDDDDFHMPKPLGWEYSEQTAEE